MATKTLVRFVLGLALALLATIVLLVVVWQKADTANRRTAGNERANCAQIEALKTVVRQVIRQGDDALGRKGTAGYAYYVAHPAELAAARKAGNIELGEFSAHACR